MTANEFAWVYYISAALALAIGLVLFRSRRRLPWEDRLLAAVVPLGVLTMAGLLLRSVFIAPHMIHNSIRLAPTFALTNGYRLYYGLEDGPSLCTVYGPIGALVYLPATLARSPASAIMVAELLVQFFFWVPLLAIQLKTARDWSQPWIMALAAIVCCGYLTYGNAPGDHGSAPLYLSAVWVHADAPRAFAMCALAVLYFGRMPYSHRALSVCAFCVGLSVWTKFSMAALPFALLLYVWLADGLASCGKLLLHLAVWGVVMSSGLLLAFGPQEMIYNTLTLVGNVPWRPGGAWPVLLDASRELLREILPFGVILIACIWWHLQAMATDPERGWRAWLREHRWTIFLVAGLVSAPLCIRLRGRFGGGENSLTPTIYFLLAATTLALLRKEERPSSPLTPLLPSLTKVLAFVLVGAFILLAAPGPKEIHGLMSAARLTAGEIAFEYLKRNPGKAYFPDDPLPALMAEGKLYHFSYGIFVFDLTGQPMTAKRFWAHVPPDLGFVCFAPAGMVIEQGHIHPVLRFIPEFSKITPADALSAALAQVGWSVFALQ